MKYHIKYPRVRCEICGQFTKKYQIRCYPVNSLSLEPPEENPTYLCQKCYKKEVLGQDKIRHEIFRFGWQDPCV